MTPETNFAFGLLAESFYGQRLWKEADTAFQELLEKVNNHDHLYKFRTWATAYRMATLVKSGRWWQAVRYTHDNFSPVEDQFWTVEAADFFGLEDYLLRICTGRFFLLALLILVPLIFGRVESLSPFLWRCRCRSISLRMRHFLVSSIMATWNCISSIASACRISVTSARGAYRWIWSKLVLS